MIPDISLDVSTYICMIRSGIKNVIMAKSAARLTVILSMIQMVFLRASIAFSGSFSRIPQYLDTSTEAPIPSPMQNI